MLCLLGDAPVIVVDIARGQRAVALQIQTCLLGEQAVEEVGGNGGRIPEIAKLAENLARLCAVRALQQGQPLAVAGFLCALGAVLETAQLLECFVGVVLALIVKKHAGPVV